MGALTKKRNRSIDSLWRGNDSLIAAVEAAAGLPIGSDDGVLFIQDVGTKVVGRAYIDKNNGKMYKCTAETTTTNNTSSIFSLITLLDETTYLRSLRQSKKIYLDIVPGKDNYYKLRDIVVYGGHICCLSITMDKTSRVFRGGAIVQLTDNNGMTWETEHVIVPLTGYKAGAYTTVEIVKGNSVPDGISNHLYLHIRVDSESPTRAECWIY